MQIKLLKYGLSLSGCNVMCACLVTRRLNESPGSSPQYGTLSSPRSYFYKYYHWLFSKLLQSVQILQGFYGSKTLVPSKWVKWQTFSFSPCFSLIIAHRWLSLPQFLWFRWTGDEVIAPPPHVWWKGDFCLFYLGSLSLLFNVTSGWKQHQCIYIPAYPRNNSSLVSVLKK